ncbi:MAG: hypothetical protein FGF50_10940 [Candidatus Brockarchaeota archaeon]|nr:hypothetical protein [Candidatus Brockarchaeota archaeon]
MSDYILTICYKWKEEGMAETEKELSTLLSTLRRPQVIVEEQYGIDEFEVMWQKKLRHLATVLATAYDIKFSKRSGMKEVYDQLRRKVKVWRRSEYPWGHGNYNVLRAFWPCEILDLKEVQDELQILTGGGVLSKDKPEDREIVRRAIKWLDEEEKQMPIEEVINDKIDLLNTYLHDLGAFLVRFAEFQRKHPDVKFWFYVEFG